MAIFSTSTTLFGNNTAYGLLFTRKVLKGLKTTTLTSVLSIHEL